MDVTLKMANEESAEHIKALAVLFNKRPTKSEWPAIIAALHALFASLDTNLSKLDAREKLGDVLTPDIRDEEATSYYMAMLLHFMGVVPGSAWTPSTQPDVGQLN